MFVAPHLDYHAFAPELVLTGALVVLLLVDLVFEERGRWSSSARAAGASRCRWPWTGTTSWRSRHSG